MLSKIAIAKVKLEILEEVIEHLTNNARDIQYNYTVVGQYQYTRYNWETREETPQFDDEGNPIMHDKYDWVKRDDLEEEEIAKVKVYEEVIKHIEKML